MASKHRPTTGRKHDDAASCQSDRDKIASLALRPTMQAGATLSEFEKHEALELDPLSLAKALQEQTKAADDNNVERGVEMLVAQAHTLDAIFHTMARRAACNLGHYPEIADRYMKLALRAQSQSRAIWETLSTIKNPLIVGYVKQANIAHGHQQVNNASPAPRNTSRAGENQNLQNELLESKDGERLDTGTTSTTGGADPEMETVGAVDGTKVSSRQGEKLSERL